MRIASLLLFSLLLALSGALANKTSIYKTIKTDHGDIYDCIDINKQPSLQHPALKDHKVQIKPPKELNLLIERLRRENPRAREAGTSRVKIGLEQGCPFGSVPIRRLASQNLTNTWNTYIRPLDDTSRAGSQFAGIVASGNSVWAGAHAFPSLHNPKVGSDQSSSSIVAMISKDGSTFNRIEAGWTVNPREYGDTQTRLYTSWTKDGYRSSGCFDMKCPGFVLTSTTMPLGYVFPELSKWRAKEVHTEILILQGPKDRRWWLVVEGNDVGYWPYEILTTLPSGAQMVKFGGEVFQPDAGESSPQMGSGTYWYGLDGTTAIYRAVHLLDANGHPIQPDSSFISVKDCNCYFAGDNHDRGDDGYCFIFGGGGGGKCTCNPS